MRVWVVGWSCNMLMRLVYVFVAIATDDGQVVRVGDLVRVKSSVVTPKYKWGSVTHQSIGTVTGQHYHHDSDDDGGDIIIVLIMITVMKYCV